MRELLVMGGGGEWPNTTKHAVTLDEQQELGLDRTARNYWEMSRLNYTPRPDRIIVGVS